MRKEFGILIILIVLCVVVSIVNPNFLSATNLQNNARLVGMFGIFGIGVGVVIMTGGIDLSVGSVFSLFGVLLAFMLVKWHWPWPIAVIVTLLATALLGLCHGLLVTKVKIQPFLVTLCGLLFYRGMARYIANDQSQGFGYCQGFETLQILTTGKICGIPMPFIILLVIASIMWVVLHKSIYGRYLLAAGRNEEAALFSGINTGRVIASAYVISTLLAGVATILLAFYTNSISPSSHGNFYELYGIAAAVLGGCSLRGGQGSVIGILIGTTLILVLRNLVNLLGIPSSLDFAIVGTVILIGVIVDQMLQRREGKGRHHS
ncbi:MAG: ABC transporter permease [Sedimentisphaerales bacterium]